MQWQENGEHFIMVVMGAGYVTCTEEMRIAYKKLVGNSARKS
jgi:hypothetical protein